MSWQPIETHPHEQDKRVLLWGKIKPEPQKYPFDSTNQAMHDEGMCVTGWWRFRRHGTDHFYAWAYGATRRFVPTHWQPIRPPPK